MVVPPPPASPCHLQPAPAAGPGRAERLGGTGGCWGGPGVEAPRVQGSFVGAGAALRLGTVRSHVPCPTPAALRWGQTHWNLPALNQTCCTKQGRGSRSPMARSSVLLPAPSGTQSPQPHSQHRGCTGATHPSGTQRWGAVVHGVPPHPSPGWERGFGEGLFPQIRGRYCVASAPSWARRGHGAGVQGGPALPPPGARLQPPNWEGRLETSLTRITGKATVVSFQEKEILKKK